MMTFSTTDAQRIVRESYGLTAVAQPLPAYEGQNFHLQTGAGQEFFLKILRLGISPDRIHFQHRVLDTLVRQGSPDAYPRPCATLAGDEIGVIVGANGHSRLMQLRTYLPGVLLADAIPHHPDLLYNLGQFLGQLDRTLQGFTHPAMHRKSDWDLKNAATAISSHLDHVVSPKKRALVKHFLIRFERNVLPILPQLGSSVIHNDANSHNLLVTKISDSLTQVSGIFDFEEVVYTQTVFELAIAIAYVILDKKEPLVTASCVATGYHSILPLAEQEWAVLYDSLCARLCVSVCMSAYHAKLDPENAYIRSSERSVWNMLDQLAQDSPNKLIHLCNKCEYGESGHGTAR